MEPYLQAALFGFIGGLARACVGFLKYKLDPKIKGFKLQAILFTLIASGIIGLFAGLFFPTDLKLSLLAGYAGTDFIEGLYKIRKKQLIQI